MNNFQFSKKHQTIAKFFLVLSLVVLIGAGCGKKNTNTTNTAQNQNSKQTVYSYQGQEGKSALQILKDKYPGQVITKSFSGGEFVESINGTKAESNKTYWAFYLNGAYSSVGAGDYQTKPSDVIEWRFEKINTKI
jgi:hypothetical protein